MRSGSRLILVCLVVVVAAGVCYAQTTAPASRPTARDPFAGMPSYGEALRRMVVSLLAIVAGLLIVAKVLPRIMGRRMPSMRGKVITVLEAHRLEPRKSIYLIRVADECYLVGSSGDRLETLAGPIDEKKIAGAMDAVREKGGGAAEKPSRSFAEFLSRK
jgi:flagellar biogenesis protein FliO